MKKLFASSIILAALVSSSAFACGGNKDEGGDKDGLKPIEQMGQVYKDCGSNKDKGTQASEEDQQV